MTERAKELLDYFTGHETEFLKLLQLLVEEETPSDKPATFTEILRILRHEFEELNFDVEYLKGDQTAGQLLCKPKDFNPISPTQLILGHCDTVWDEGTLDRMPFKKEGDKVFGPGIYDMKTGICMMVFAMQALRDLDKELGLQPVFLINSDEETGSDESAELIKKEAKHAERCFVLEPSLGNDGKIKTRRKGIGEFEITISGKPSHAGLAPEEGVSAILGLSHIVQQLFKLNDPARGITVNVGTIEGGERSNVIAAQSRAVVDVRVPTVEDGKRIKHKIYNLKPELNGIDISVSGDIRRKPMEKNKANEALWQTTLKLGTELELELKEGCSGGASDGNITNLYSPTIDGLGAVGEGAHAYHEKIFLKETLQRTALLTLLLLEPASHW